MNAESKLKTIIREEYKRAKLINNINIKTITPGVISRVRGRSSKLIIRLSVKTINGYKAIARKGKTAQEVFISTELSKDELKRIINIYNN